MTRAVVLALRQLDSAARILDDALDRVRADAERRLNLPAGAPGAIDDPAYAAALDAIRQLAEARNAVRSAFEPNLQDPTPRGE